MAGKDWSKPLPEGWILKRNAKGECAYNVKTGQKFHTKKDLLRYVHYVETAKLSLSGDDNNFEAPLSDDSETDQSDGDSSIEEEEEEEEEEDKEEEEEAPKNDEFHYKLTSDDDVFSLAKAFASYESSSCKPLDGSSVGFATASNAQKAEILEIVDDAQKTAGGMANDAQKDQRPGKEIELAGGQAKKRGGPKQKYELPPKKFRGWKALSIRPPSSPRLS